MFKVGDKVKVKNNLRSELEKLTFEEGRCESMQKEYANTEQEIFALWKDEETSQEYASIDLCVEIPVQCLELACL